ncbi:MULTISPECIES: hypothetical protein [Bartonella]|uniref:hypothetical protein n=1 Tax=Bartonella TaxID=773 RepID=UPI002360D1CA|nr:MULTISPECIES: hypothetical protein [Bartonella]
MIIDLFDLSMPFFSDGSFLILSCYKPLIFMVRYEACGFYALGCFFVQVCVGLFIAPFEGLSFEGHQFYQKGSMSE